MFTNSGYTVNLYGMEQAGYRVEDYMQDYPCEDPKVREYFNNIFKQYNLFRDIGFETPDLFGMRLKSALNVVMPYYIDKLAIEKQMRGLDPHITYQEIVDGNITRSRNTGIVHGLTVTRTGNTQQTSHTDSQNNTTTEATSTGEGTRTPELTRSVEGSGTSNINGTTTQTDGGSDTTTRNPNITNTEGYNGYSETKQDKMWGFPASGGSAGMVKDFSDDHATAATLSINTPAGEKTNKQTGNETAETQYGKQTQGSSDTSQEDTNQSTEKETGTEKTSTKDTTSGTQGDKGSVDSTVQGGSEDITQNTGEDTTTETSTDSDNRTRFGSSEFIGDVLQRWQSAIKSVEKEFVEDKMLNSLFMGLLW